MAASGQQEYFLPPRDDINSPDMYIPGTIPSTLIAGRSVHPRLTFSYSYGLCHLHSFIGSSRRASWSL